MALINCYECGRASVSSSASACPGCGFNIAKKTHQLKQIEYENSPAGIAERERKEEEQALYKSRKKRGLCVTCGSILETKHSQLYGAVKKCSFNNVHKIY